ncbi:MAG: GTPase Era [Fimbriimonadaceae bacterium]
MDYRTGFAALIGKPNVGKSTLVNALVGQKVAIVSNKPQTTRRRLLGIHTRDDAQIIYVDTPGIHEPHTRLGRTMVESARGAISEVDVLLFVVDGSMPPSDDDRHIAATLRSRLDAEFREKQSIVVLNKMDKLPPEFVLAHIDAYTRLIETASYMLTTATKNHNLTTLEDMIVERLPIRPAIFPEDEFTDQSARFLSAELVREKILQRSRQEIPHATAVVVDSWDESESEVRITASIIVERESQKAIVIGKGGAFLRDIGKDARQEIQELLGKPTHLGLFVKVKEGWRMNPRLLHEWNYQDS